MTNLKNIEVFIKRVRRMKGDDSIVTRKEKQREDLIQDIQKSNRC